MFCFHYGAGEIAEWFEQEIERSGAAEPDGKPVRTVVKMRNVLKGSQRFISDYAAMKVLLETNTDEVVYYHSTTSASAVNILQYGIDLSKSRGRQDFSNGNGFYVTNNIKRAKAWATIKARGGTGAIIAFKVSKNLEEEEPHLSLDVRTNEGRALWKKTVDYFRKGTNDEEVKSSQEGKKFITGPAFVIFNPCFGPSP